VGLLKHVTAKPAENFSATVASTIAYLGFGDTAYLHAPSTGAVDPDCAVTVVEATSLACNLSAGMARCAQNSVGL